MPPDSAAARPPRQQRPVRRVVTAVPSVTVQRGGLPAVGVAHAQAQQLVRKPRSPEAAGDAVHGHTQFPPVIFGQRRLPGDDLYLEHAAGTEHPDAGKKTATFALRATGWLIASKTSASRPGGLDHGGSSGSRAAAVSSSAGAGSKNMNPRYAWAGRAPDPPDGVQVSAPGDDVPTARQSPRPLRHAR